MTVKIPPKILSLKKASEYTGLSRYQLIHYIEGGVLPYINSSRGAKKVIYNVMVEELDKLLQKIQTTM